MTEACKACHSHRAHCFTGSSGFGDFVDHLGVPKAVLTVRLAKLVAAGILRRVNRGTHHYDYHLTERGGTLWPMLFSMPAWGDTHLAPAGGRRRNFSHQTCGSLLLPDGRCPHCKIAALPGDVVISNGPGAERHLRDDPVTRALDEPHRMLTALAVAGRDVAPLTKAKKPRGKKRARRG